MNKAKRIGDEVREVIEGKSWKASQGTVRSLAFTLSEKESLW